MDVADIAVQALASISSAAIGVAVASWRLSARLQKLESKAEAQEKELGQIKTDVDTLTKENQQSWQNLNFTLGQISQAMGLAPMMRPPTQSKP